jgi:hypothetical protein
MFKQLLFNKISSALLSFVLISGQIVSSGFLPIQSTVSEPGEFLSEAVTIESSETVDLMATSPEWVNETVDNDIGAGSFTSAAINSDDVILISYSHYESETWKLRFAEGETGNWSTSVIEDSGSVGTYNAIALDAAANPHVSYYDVGNTALKYAYRDGVAWVNTTVDSSANVGKFSSLAIDQAGGTVHISYSDDTNKDLKYALWDGSVWENTTVDSPGAVGTYTSLGLRGAVPRISYRNLATDTLRYAIYSSSTGSWDTYDIASPGTSGISSSLVMDTSGYEHISYSDSERGVRYIFKDLSGWHDSLVVSDSGALIPTALALDSTNLPHIAYVGGDGFLYYATQNNRGAWSIVTVDESGTVGTESVSIVVDSEDHPHIIYHSTTDGLKHAWYTPLPDLIITDIWSQAGQIWCQVRNIGKAEAPGGHTIAMIIDAEPAINHVVTHPLAAGERYNALMASWTCSDRQDTIQATADRSSDIVEADETNNVREETLLCDTIAPMISHPTVTDIQTTSVTITWTTNEDSDSRVYYGSSGAGYSWEEYDDSSVMNHQITLSLSLIRVSEPTRGSYIF